MNQLIKIKIYLTQIILIFLIVIFTHGVKSDQLTTTCGIKLNNLVCMNIDFKNNIQVNLLDNPYRIIIDFEKPIEFKNRLKLKQNKNTLFKIFRLSSKLQSGSRLVLVLSEPAIISDIFFNKIKNNNQMINLEMSITKTSITSFSIAKHVLSKHKGDFLALTDKIDLIE